MNHPLLDRLQTQHGVPLLELDAIAAHIQAAAPKISVLFCTEDPRRFDETLDLAVVLPQLLKSFPQRLSAAVIARSAEKAVQARYGFRTWPALVFVSAAGWHGTIEGMRNWADFVRETADILDAAPRRAPGIGVPVAAADASAACH
ncbi:MAG TPA: hydrogenase [Plasticicumulans sp.]|uniref:hydrogenase n=1 Tax=Plasticicumulans sp. TaxID=2307179 RepID=UPI002B996600|nr:hydrogenase [Plasticicumulans sp.]HMW27962.1 hydrogenase [Plasticicumulans sp.]HMW27970.1 hydrogenase [Plasticicumulans sp.]HNG51355.1 hydrogenase [Plasticicumulans sp.]HNI24561.1 hydrogenase [Plasticicumulans sp.]HNM44390.1 hydrogenase [Plasticicumulans sp.]